MSQRISHVFQLAQARCFCCDRMFLPWALIALTLHCGNSASGAAIMILQHISSLNAKRIVLASGSPRRKELLGNLGLKFEIMVSSFEETLPHHWFENAADYAVETARHKALDVAQVCAAQTDRPPVDLIISADTIVEHGGYILEKPDDVEHARKMLESLSGSSHHVHTGVALVLPQAAVPAGQEGPFCRTFSETTNVIFHELTTGLIDAYIHTGEPFGKAGSYGIQGAASSFVTGLSGCYFNVVGFPLHSFSKAVLQLVEEGHLPLATAEAAVAAAAISSSKQ